MYGVLCSVTTLLFLGIVKLSWWQFIIYQFYNKWYVNMVDNTLINTQCYLATCENTKSTFGPQSVQLWIELTNVEI